MMVTMDCRKGHIHRCMPMHTLARELTRTHRGRVAAHDGDDGLQEGVGAVGVTRRAAAEGHLRSADIDSR